MRFLFLIFGILFASEIKIKSKFFKFKNNTSIFTQNVLVTKGKDKISCNKLIINFENKKPVKLTAIKNVKFTFKDKNETYIGKCNKLIYFFKSKKVILINNALIKKLSTNEILKGDLISFNRKTKTIEVKGKPVNMIIKVNE